MNYKPVIGLEIHVELKTKTKMFCSCRNGLGLEKRPNINICPICTAQPGTLPVINKKAVEYVVKTGFALNCTISEISKFDRKNYFYPDLPKGYQISQYDKPIALEGGLKLKIENEKLKTIRIRRIHLEEDTGKLIHPTGANYSLVDYNRAGVPLMELVTEPDISSGGEARRFCEELQLILRYLEVSHADMEKGQMRCEVNISLNKSRAEKLGTKVEIKNLNSFRAVERAIDYEIERQSELLEDGKKIVQETRGWNDARQITFSERRKEEAHDYRYFTEPDLPPLVFTSKGEKESSDLNIEEIKASVPELPRAKRERFKKEYVLGDSILNFLITSPVLADFFERVASELNEWCGTEGLDEKKKRKARTLAANYIATEFPRYLKTGEEPKITAENYAELIKILAKGEISSSAGQVVLQEMFHTGADPSHVIEEKNLVQVSDESVLRKIVESVIKNNPQAASDYKKGKENALKFLMGQVMRESKGAANPGLVAKILEQKLK